MTNRILIALAFAILLIGWCEWSKASFLDQWKPSPVTVPEC